MLVSNNRGKLKVNILCVFLEVCRSLTWHSSTVPVRLGTSYVRHFSSMGLENPFSSHFITRFYQHDLWSYLSQILPHSEVVLLICSREVIFVKHPLLIWPHLLQSQITPIILRYLLFRVNDMGIIMALLWWITSYRLQLIIQEGDLETSSQYLGACWSEYGNTSFFVLSPSLVLNKCV